MKSLSVFLIQKRWGILLCVVLFLGLTLRFYRLDYKSLWCDEIITIHASIQPIMGIPPERDPNILPLYYLIVHPLLGFENREFWLRFPSVIFGMLSILLIYLVIRDWHGRSAGFLGAIIMSISPFHVCYSQEARPYAMLILLSLLSIFILQKLIKKESNHWLKFGFILFTAATFYCHTVAIAFIGYLVIYVLMVVPRKKWGKWLPVFVSIILLLLPGFYRMLIIPPDISADPERSFNLLSIPYTIWTFSTGYSLGPTLSELHMPDHISYVYSNLYIIIPVMLFFSVFFTLGAYQLWKKYNLIFWLVALLFIFPLIFAVLGSILTVHPFNVRYAIISFLPYIVFLAVGFKSLKNKWMHAGALAILVIISTLSLSNYFFNERYHREDTRAAGYFLSANAMANDLVICSAPYTVKTLRYYYNSNKDLDFTGYPIDIKYVEYPKLKSDFKKIIADKK